MTTARPSRAPGVRPGVAALATAVIAVGALRYRFAPPPPNAPTPTPAVADTPRAYDPARWPTAAAGAPPPDATAVAHGAALYAAHCASCHGARLEGQPEWQAMRPDGSLPAPPHDASGHTWHHGDGMLLRIIAEGGTFYLPSSQMPGFASVLSEPEMRAVLTFIKTTWGPDELAWQARATASESATAAP